MFGIPAESFSAYNLSEKNGPPNSEQVKSQHVLIMKTGAKILISLHCIYSRTSIARTPLGP